MAIAGLILNMLIVGLLVATISYCWALNRRIKVLQDSKSELAQLLKYFDESTQRASESIIALQTASKKIGENIQLRIDKANYLLDDLAFMIDKGNKIASQMEAGFAVNRARTRVLQSQMSANGEEKTEALPEPARQTAIEAPAVAEHPAPPKLMDKVSNKDKTAASLEAVLERVVGRSKPAIVEDEARARPPTPPTRARSKAEQELLDMLKTGMKG